MAGSAWSRNQVGGLHDVGVGVVDHPARRVVRHEPSLTHLAPVVPPGPPGPGSPAGPGPRTASPTRTDGAVAPRGWRVGCALPLRQPAGGGLSRSGRRPRRGRPRGRRRPGPPRRGWPRGPCCRRAAQVRRAASTICAWSASWWLVGSSASSTTGCATTAAGDGQALLLPEGGLGRRTPGQRDRGRGTASTAAAGRWTSSRVEPASRSTSSTFSATDSSASGLRTWGTMAVRSQRRQAPRSAHAPIRSMAPPSGSHQPTRSARSVLFPLPDRPRTMTTSPRAASNESGASPLAASQCLATPTPRTTAGAGGAGPALTRSSGRGRAPRRGRRPR